MRTYFYSCLLLVALSGGIIPHILTEEVQDVPKDELDKKSLKCNSTATNPIGKFEFNQNTTDLICTLNVSFVNASNVYLFFEKLILDEGDNVTIREINTSETNVTLLKQANPVLLITGYKTAFIEFRTSHRLIKRTFAVSYSTSPTCSFAIDDDIEVVTNPIYAPNATNITCSYLYAQHPHPNITYAFSFDSFNLPSSTLQVEGAAESGTQTFSASNPPTDFMSKKGDTEKVSVEVTSPPGEKNEFVLRQHLLYTGCSGYFEITPSVKIDAMHKPDLLEEDIPIECRWHFRNKNQNEALGVQLHSLEFQNPYDVVFISNGPKTTFPFLTLSNDDKDVYLARDIRSSSSDIMVSFRPVSFSSNISFTVFQAGSGKYMQNNGTFEAKGSPEYANKTIFTLQVPDKQNVFVNFKSLTIASPTYIEIYEDFSTQGKSIATLRGNVWYPVISSTSKMLIAVYNFDKNSFSGDFSGVSSGCVRMSPGISDSYILSGHCKSVCSWIIPPTNTTDELVLHFQFTALEKDDFIEVLKLDDKHTLIANITSADSHIPALSINAMEGVYVNISRGACTPQKEKDIVLVAHTDYLPGCSKNYTLDTQQVTELTSPRFPDTYPMFAECKMQVKRNGSAKVLHMKFDHFQLAENHCIDVTVVINGTHTATTHLNGTELPADLVIAGDAFVDFNALEESKTSTVSTFASKQGFAINVTAFEYGGFLKDKENSFTFPANCSKGIFMVTIEAKPKANAISFTFKADNKTGNYAFHVHDGSSVRNDVMKNLTEGVEIWSRTNSLIFEYDRVDSKKPSGAITVQYKTQNCNEWCENSLCLHPDWKCDGKNDCGDNTDELGCKYPPPPSPSPPPSEKKTGNGPLALDKI